MTQVFLIFQVVFDSNFCHDYSGLVTCHEFLVGGVGVRSDLCKAPVGFAVKVVAGLG